MDVGLDLAFGMTKNVLNTVLYILLKFYAPV